MLYIFAGKRNGHRIDCCNVQKTYSHHSRDCQLISSHVRPPTRSLLSLLCKAETGYRNCQRMRCGQSELPHRLISEVLPSGKLETPLPACPSSVTSASDRFSCSLPKLPMQSPTISSPFHSAILQGYSPRASETAALVPLVDYLRQ